MSTKTCPYCNAAEDPNWAYENAVWFRCGTMITPDRTNRASQTNQCVEDEVGRLTDQRDQLAARVKELEAVVSDPHTLWANWLRGTVQLPAGIGDIRMASDRIKMLEKALDLVYPSCGYLHHPKRFQHKFGEPCPSEEFVSKAKEATR